MSSNSTSSGAATAPEPPHLFLGISLDNVIAFVGIFLTIVLLYLATRKIQRTKGRKWKYHLIYVAFSTVILIFSPLELRQSLFSPFTIMCVGSVWPIYESIYAVCTLITDDDTVWLQYWLAQGTLSFSTEWIDNLESSQFQQRWFEFEFFFMLWLSLPWTDGATLLFDYVTEPLLGDRLAPIVKAADGWINKAALAVVNASHLWILWAAFEILPASWKRMIWVLIGTVFPLASSLVAVITPMSMDDTFWLTYWSGFGVLFLVTDMLENYLGWVPGFYTVAIFITMYLMLPLFNGAEKVFRHILVPLAGLQEMLIRKDAEMIKEEVMRAIPEERREMILREIGESYLTEGKRQEGYQSIPVV